jgi:hypothetical protein
MGEHLITLLLALWQIIHVMVPLIIIYYVVFTPILMLIGLLISIRDRGTNREHRHG